MTEVGKIREHNEDVIRVIVGDEKLRARGIDGLYLVADGMGGHGAGEVASEIAADVINQQVGERAFPRGVGQFSELTPVEQQKWLLDVVNQANHAIFQRRETAAVSQAANLRVERDMGTTLVMAVRSGDEVAIANVGDSRAYMISRDGKTIQQLTTDHSMVARLVATKQITPEEAGTHPQRNLIYRTMGDKPRVEADVFFAKIPLGGALLLCSDGLWEMVEDEQIRQILVSSGSAKEATRRLIEAANAAGGEDNISAIVVKRRVEEELTFDEKVFVAQLEDLVKLEEATATRDMSQLQRLFENVRLQFAKLPVGGQLRVEVMKNVVEQLGVEGEKLRKTGKKDKEIFEEWLKRVFTPLYRRARKQ